MENFSRDEHFESTHSFIYMYMCISKVSSITKVNVVASLSWVHVHKVGSLNGYLQTTLSIPHIWNRDKPFACTSFQVQSSGLQKKKKKKKEKKRRHKY